MIGIYLITNLVNGFKYVGQSINIKRRFYEYKISNDKGKIDKAIKEIGIDNFKFEVLEECEKEELLTKELFYIKKLNPEYNFRIKDLENFLGACTGTCAAYWKGKIKSVKGYHVVKCRD